MCGLSYWRNIQGIYSSSNIQSNRPAATPRYAYMIGNCMCFRYPRALSKVSVKISLVPEILLKYHYLKCSFLGDIKQKHAPYIYGTFYGISRLPFAISLLAIFTLLSFKQSYRCIRTRKNAHTS